MTSTVVYAVGIVYASVCTNEPNEEMLLFVNSNYPTTLGSSWKIANEAFATGETNPTACDAEPMTRRHVLLVC